MKTPKTIVEWQRERWHAERDGMYIYTLDDGVACQIYFEPEESAQIFDAAFLSVFPKGKAIRMWRGASHEERLAYVRKLNRAVSTALDTRQRGRDALFFSGNS